MAKSVEDTAFYRHGRLLALNEVGGEPDAEGLEPASFHRLAARRLEQWPDTLLATATHDTKRGEDGRARLAVLSELAGEWAATVDGWRALNSTLPAIHPRTSTCSTRAWWAPGPRAGPGRCGGARGARRPPRELATEVAARGQGALGLEPAGRDLRGPGGGVPALLAVPGRRFAQAAAAFVGAMPRRPRQQSGPASAQATVPGVPDIYQGTELGDYSLVHPDNRRAVDFARRARLLAEGGWDLHGPKLYLLARGLALERFTPSCLPAAATSTGGGGSAGDQRCRIRRVLDEHVAITVVSRRLGRELAALGAPVLGQEA